MIIYEDKNVGLGFFFTGLCSKEAYDVFAFTVAYDIIQEMASRNGTVDGFVDISPWMILDSKHYMKDFMNQKRRNIPKIRAPHEFRQFMLKGLGFTNFNWEGVRLGEIFIDYSRCFPMGEVKVDALIKRLQNAVHFLNKLKPHKDEMTIFTEGPDILSLDDWFGDDVRNHQIKGEYLFNFGRMYEHKLKKSTFIKIIHYLQTNEADEALLGATWDTFKETAMNEFKVDFKKEVKEHRHNLYMLQAFKERPIDELANYIDHCEKAYFDKYFDIATA